MNVSRSLVILIFIISSLILLGGCLSPLDFMNSEQQSGTVKEKLPDKQLKPLINKNTFTLSNIINIDLNSEFPFKNYSIKYSVISVKFVSIKYHNKTVCYNYIYEFLNENNLEDFYKAITTECNATDYYILGEPCKRGVLFTTPVYIVGLEGGQLVNQGQNKAPLFVPKKCILILSIKANNVSDADFYKGVSYLNYLLREHFIKEYGSYKVIYSNVVKSSNQGIINYYKELFGANQ